MVIALHAIVGWLLVLTTRLRTAPLQARGFAIVFIAPSRVDSPVATRPPAPQRNPQRAARRGRSPGGNGAPTSLPETGPRTEPGSSPRNATNQPGPSLPPIDWEEELARAAKHAGTEHTGPEPKDFGFPHAGAAPSAKTEQFGWDYAPTHRVESIPGGGLLVNLNDNCVLVFVPFPFVLCQPGKKPANGELFKHLHDAPDAGAESGNP